MSDALLYYLNNEIKLSKKIKYVDRDFKSGYLFAEILSTTGYLDPNDLSLFNKNAKTKLEIKQNYLLLKEHLQNLGVHLDELTINALINNNRGSAANLIYKIKTQIDRRNIRFDDIMTKINKYQNEEKKDKSIEKIFNKTSYRTQSNFNNSASKLPELSYMSTFYGTKTNFNKIKPVLPYTFSGKNLNTLKFDEDKKNENINYLLLNDKKVIKKKLEPITNKKPNLIPISLKRTKNENNELLKLQIDSKNKISEKDENQFSNDSKFYQQQQKKFKSHGKNEQKLKDFSEKYLENNNNYMKYSCFDNNTLKIGIDIKEIDPKLGKQGIGFNNDYIPSDLVLSRLQDIVNQKEEEYKKKLEEKKFMTEEERYLKNSIISQNQKNDSGKKFEIHFNKNTQLYKMHEYEKYREENFPFKEKINTKLLYQKEDNENENDEKENEEDNAFENKRNPMEKTYSSTMDKFYTKTIMTNFSKEYNDFKSKRNFSDFNEDNFFEDLEKETLSERKRKEIKRKIVREKNYNDIRSLTHLIIDLTEEFYYCQNQQNIEFIEVPEFKKIISNFIEGKINLSSQNKNKNSLVNLEDGNLPKGDENGNEEFLYDEKYFSEYNDYIYYRGQWEENKYIPKNFYGSQLQVYQVLGEDINHLTSSGKMITQGLKPSILSKMKNEDFELKENEKDNINVPKENTKNRLLGEIIELNFDNLPYNFAMNSINSYLEINNMVKSNSDIKLVSNKKIFLNQDATINNNTNIEDTNYSNNKDLFKINSSNINSTNIINNELNISTVKQDGKKSNNSLEDTLFNNNANNANINNTNINNSNVNQNIGNNFSHIPIKMCLIGHSFSGRKTQAKLLSNKYPKLKYYSIEKIIDDYFNEYERLHTPIENNPKLKNPKKNQIEQLKIQRLEELKQYEEAFKIIEPYIQDNKKCKDLTDEAKINIFIMQLKKDFLAKEGDIYAEVTRRNARKQAIEQDLERIKEEAEKKKKYGAKEIREQQLLMKELEDLVKDGYSGFILVDFPNTYNQFVKLENTLTGFVQQIDKEENLRDKYLGLLTFSLDKTYANISNLCPEVMNYLGHGGDALYKSFFNNYIWLEIDEEETLKRVNDRLIDENTNIIYHKEFNPPPAGDKKLLERLKPVTEPSEEDIKNELKKYDIEFPKNLSYISLFHNLKKISKINKNEIFEDINEILTNAVKKFEDRENKDEIVALNNCDLDESENIKYFKKLNEVKKKVNKEISGNIISLWSESISSYSKGVKRFLYYYSNLKKNILEKMNIMQTVFFQYLNGKTQKQRLVEIFQRKYEVFLDKYHNLRRKKIVKDEFQKDVIELTEHYWEIIQMKKRDSINELKNLKEQNFIEKQSEFFWDYISKLFLLETNFYIKKINLIKKYYYEFEGNKYSEKCPYEYTLDENDLLKEINEYAIYNKKTENKKEKNSKSKSKNKEQNNNNSNSIYDRLISPRIDRIFKNCFKFLFNYDKKMSEISQKEKEKYALNASNISNISKRKHRGKKSVNDGISIFSESKNIISYEDEMKAALNNEKIKYKIRISLLKFFGEGFLIEANNICDKTFENLDNSIIKSVDAQNRAMNEVMEKIKKDIFEGRNKLTYNIELDVFDIYQVLNINFKEFILHLYNNFDSKDKKIDISELNKIYLDLKNYEIQDNYATLNSVIDVVFKKHLFEFKSNAFLNYLKELPYHYLNNFIKKFIYKTPADQSLVRIDRLFTILSILNFSPPKPSQKKEMIDNATNKLKLHCFLSKEDFMNTILWYEKDDIKKDNKNNINNSGNFNNNIYNLNSPKANAFDYNANQSNVIIEEKNEEKLYNDIDLTNKDDINDNDLILTKGKNNDDINSETRQQMNILFKNLAYKSPNKRGRRASRKISHKSSIPIKIISEETKLKEFLFNINKNYDNQINFIDFINVVCLQFIKNKKQKKTIIKQLDINTILNMAKSGKLPKPYKEDKKKMTFNRKTTQFYQTKGGKYEDMYHRASSQSLNKFNIHDIKTAEKQNKNKQILIGGDSEFNIIKEGEFIIINGKKYSIDSFNENVYTEMTYLDELIEDESKHL